MGQEHKVFLLQILIFKHRAPPDLLTHHNLPLFRPYLRIYRVIGIRSSFCLVGNCAWRQFQFKAKINTNSFDTVLAGLIADYCLFHVLTFPYRPPLRTLTYEVVYMGGNRVRLVELCAVSKHIEASCTYSSPVQYQKISANSKLKYLKKTLVRWISELAIFIRWYQYHQQEVPSDCFYTKNS